MGHFLLISFFLVVVAAASHAVLPPEVVYWNSVLPRTPMPGAIQDLIRPSDAYVDEKDGTSVGVGKGGVAVNTGKGKPGGTSVNVGKGGVNVNTGKGKPSGTGVNVGPGGVHVNTGKGKGKPGGASVNVGHGGVNVRAGKGGHGGPTVNVAPFIYNYAATDTQIHDDPTVALFFLEKNLKPGTKMNLHFTKTTSGAAFVTRRQANSVPFSSTRLPEILSRFSVAPNSIEAESMKETLRECEEPAQAGETKLCATSLEQMVEFSTRSLGTRDVRAVSTAVDREGTAKQVYSVAPSGVRKLAGSELVVCHARNYAYAVFYCHTTRGTRAYEVAMVGEDGARAEAVAVCHVDTGGWNPKHVAFRVLGVKPGTVPVCHFLPQDHLVWSPNK